MTIFVWFHDNFWMNFMTIFVTIFVFFIPVFVVFMTKFVFPIFFCFTMTYTYTYIYTYRIAFDCSVWKILMQICARSTESLMQPYQRQLFLSTWCYTDRQIRYREYQINKSASLLKICSKSLIKLQNYGGSNTDFRKNKKI